MTRSERQSGFGGVIAPVLFSLLGTVVVFAPAAAQNRKEYQTKYGVARIVGEFGGSEKCLYFGTKILYCSKQDNVSFGGEIQTANYSVVFVNEDCGGSGCGRPTVSFLVAFKRGVRFDSSNKQEPWRRDRAEINYLKDSFTVSTLQEWGYVHRLAFRRGAFDYARTSVRTQSKLTEEDCSYLTEQLLPACASSEGNCKDPLGEMAMVHMRNYNGILERNFRFPRTKFEQLCRDRCLTQKEVSRGSVAEAICGQAQQ